MIFCSLKVTEDFGTDPHPHLDPLVRGTDPRIGIRTNMSRIRTNMSRIRSTASDWCGVTTWGVVRQPYCRKAVLGYILGLASLELFATSTAKSIDGML